MPPNAGPGVEIRLLGPVEARLEGRPVELGARKQRAVLAMLGLEVGRTVSADRLMEGLWGEHPPSSAPKMVQLYVSQLRRLLAGDSAEIVTRGRGYELRLADGAVDAARFEELLEEARAREALSLWRGSALSDVADEPFAAAEIRRLDELRLRAAELAIDEDLTEGRHRELVGEIESLVAEHPMSERLRGQRMLALYRAGRQAEALEAYRDARAALVDQAGIEPGAELRALHDRILAQDPSLDLPPAPSRAPPEAAKPGPAARGRRRRRLVAGALLLFAGLGAFGVSRLLAPDSLSGIAENSVGVIDADGSRITDQYAVGRSPGAVVAGGGSIWVANTLDGTVSRIDRGRDRPVTFIPVGGSPSALAFAAGSLWVADGDARTVAQVDPGANRVLASIEVGNAPRALAAAGGALWVASGVDASLRRIDLDRPRAGRAIPVGANPTALAAGAGALWVSSEEAGTVTRLDPRTGAVIRAINVGNGPGAIAVGEGAVWVLNRPDGTLSRIDPATNSVSSAIPVGRDPAGVTVGGGSVWIAGGDEGTVVQVDAKRARVVKRTRVGGSPAALALAGGSVWAAAAPSEARHRGGTLRVLLTASPPVLVPINWLAGDDAFIWQNANLASLAYDGLVAYRRVHGAGGASIVGALAIRAPPPSRDGRSYVFTLRAGIRYANGEPVRPEDFRASLERYFLAARGGATEFFTGIVGAEKCVKRPRSCDLSRGIVTDERTRTITIHLTRPDQEFLHKLTLEPAYLVPFGAPARSSPDLVVPGTGPYRFVRWDSRRGGTLVRNAFFAAGAQRSRPAGFADSIEVRLRSVEETEGQIADVRRGVADLAVVANPFFSAVSTERLRSLAASAPGRLHSDPVASTDWMFLNVRRRPFDDRRVRRAVSLATDRDRLVELEGGPEVGLHTCQIIPAAFPGYEPYCPHSASPAPGRGWIAPDMARARELVAASGRAGARVTLWVPDFRRSVGRYFVRLLDDLGFRASLREIGLNEYFKRIQAKDSTAQMGFAGWGSDYLSASSFVQPNFTCESVLDRPPPNASQACDPTLNRQVERALATPGPEASATWAAADRRIVDLALAVPMTNRRFAVLVSKRVGNVEHHAQRFTLLDRLWVR